MFWELILMPAEEASKLNRKQEQQLIVQIQKELELIIK